MWRNQALLGASALLRLPDQMWLLLGLPTAFSQPAASESSNARSVFHPAGGEWLYARQVVSEMTETRSARVIWGIRARQTTMKTDRFMMNLPCLSLFQAHDGGMRRQDFSPR